MPLAPQTVMRNGRIICRLPGMKEIQSYCREQIGRLPGRLRAINRRAAYPVKISPALRKASEAATKEQRP